MFRASNAHLQEDIVVYKQHMVLSLSIKSPGGLLIRSYRENSPGGLSIHSYREDCVSTGHQDSYRE